MRVPTVSQLEAALSSQGWIVHREPLRLNVVVLRKTPGTIDAFDDMLVVFWAEPTGQVRSWACRCTADPGKPSREHPKRRDGTAVVAVGQMVDGFGFGLHHGEYECLVPLRPVPVLRYTSLDDETGEPSTSSSTQIHRANATRESTVVGPWSEGCVVVANPNDYARLLEICHLAKKAGWAAFTVSVLEWPA